MVGRVPCSSRRGFTPPRNLMQAEQAEQSGSDQRCETCKLGLGLELAALHSLHVVLCVCVCVCVWPDVTTTHHAHHTQHAQHAHQRTSHTTTKVYMYIGTCMYPERAGAAWPGWLGLAWLLDWTAIWTLPVGWQAHGPVQRCTHMIGYRVGGGWWVL